MVCLRLSKKPNLLTFGGISVSFTSFNLDPVILSTIDTLGYTTPTPIQEQTIQPILAGKDVMGLAQTGTGKTAAFVIPILQKLLTGSRSSVRALIIAPTRELAQQIYDAIQALSKGTKLKSVTLYGGVKINPQIKNLKDGVEIIVACPGRLLDHLQQKTVNLSNVEMLVLDEADQMFDMGFLPDIRKILRYLPKKRQTLLFSATMPSAINELAQEVLYKPVKVQIGHSAPATSVEQVLFPVASHLKSELLIHLLHKISKESVLVFTRTKHTAKKLAIKLEKSGFSAASLQGNLSQNRRQAAMKGFRDGSLQILVATDIAARGIDVANISHVINYDIPDTVETYIHRIGRTGRAAKEGEAFTLVTHDDQPQIRAIERVLGRKVELRELNDFNYAAKAPAQPVKNMMATATRKPMRSRKPQQRRSDKKSNG
jgi:ATP-dependent RNA helicase RhlE